MKRILVNVAAFLFGCSLLGNAQAQILVGGNDRGGQIGHYQQRFAALADTRGPILVAGNCLSACTLVLGLVSTKRLCILGDTKLGFHAAWVPDKNGRPQTSPEGTQALMDVYPSDIHRIIRRHGGLRRKMFYVQGRELPGRYRAGCGTDSPAYASRTRHAEKRSTKASASK